MSWVKGSVSILFWILTLFPIVMGPSYPAFAQEAQKKEEKPPERGNDRLKHEGDKIDQSWLCYILPDVVCDGLGNPWVFWPALFVVGGGFLALRWVRHQDIADATQHGIGAIAAREQDSRLADLVAQTRTAEIRLRDAIVELYRKGYLDEFKEARLRAPIDVQKGRYNTDGVLEEKGIDAIVKDITPATPPKVETIAEGAEKTGLELALDPVRAAQKDCFELGVKQHWELFKEYATLLEEQLKLDHGTLTKDLDPPKTVSTNGHVRAPTDQHNLSHYAAELVEWVREVNERAAVIVMQRPAEEAPLLTSRRDFAHNIGTRTRLIWPALALLILVGYTTYLGQQIVNARLDGIRQGTAEAQGQVEADAARRAVLFNQRTFEALARSAFDHLKRTYPDQMKDVKNPIDSPEGKERLGMLENAFKAALKLHNERYPQHANNRIVMDREFMKDFWNEFLAETEKVEPSVKVLYETVPRDKLVEQLVDQSEHSFDTDRARKNKLEALIQAMAKMKEEERTKFLESIPDPALKAELQAEMEANKPKPSAQEERQKADPDPDNPNAAAALCEEAWAKNVI